MNTLMPESRRLSNTLYLYTKDCQDVQTQKPGTVHEQQSLVPRYGKVLICRHCNTLITYTCLAAEIDGTSVHTQCNPSGALFRYQCYLKAPGCIISGKPTTEFSWHSGYQWQYAHCTGCHRHLGWFFSGLKPAFFGLLISHLSTITPKDR